MKKLIQKWLGITKLQEDKCYTDRAIKWIFDNEIRSDIKKLDDKIIAMAKANMSQALECRIGELEDIIKEESDGISNV